MSSKRQAKRNDIARSAIAPLSAAGVRNVTLTDIGASLGMTGAHLLYYFESKVDLFMAALQMVEQDLDTSVRTAFEEMPSARDRWNWVLETGAPAGLDDSGLLMWLEAWTEAVHDPSVHALISQLETNWQSLLRDTLEYAVKRGELPESTDVDLITEGVSALLDGLTIRVVVGYRPVDHEVAMRVVDRFVSPLLPWQEATNPEAGA